MRLAQGRSGITLERLHLTDKASRGAGTTQGTYRPEKGQWEQFTAMFKSGLKGPAVEALMDIHLNSYNPLFELHVMRITVTGATWTSGGQA